MAWKHRSSAVCMCQIYPLKWPRCLPSKHVCDQERTLKEHICLEKRKKKCHYLAPLPIRLNPGSFPHWVQLVIHAQIIAWFTFTKSRKVCLFSVFTGAFSRICCISSCYTLICHHLSVLFLNTLCVLLVIVKVENVYWVDLQVISRM